MSPYYRGHSKLNILNIYSIDNFDIKSIVINLQEYLLLLATKGLAETLVYTLPSVTF
jgi:hypothetical protein